MRRHRIAAVMLAAALAVGAGATAAGAAVTTAKAPVCKGKTKKKALKAVKATWTQVLDFTTPPSRPLEDHFAAIQGSDDPEFAAVLTQIANTNAGLLPTVTVKINKVTCQGKKKAQVLYDLVISGAASPGLAGPGFAVLEGKHWLMSQGTVCDLFSLADPTLVESGPCAEIAGG